ncbi:MAG: hypothetical protein ACRDK3_04550 [Actinomycetota bacterium]
MKHDPEKAAASYLSGEMRGRRRDTFEAHIMDCEDCWTEVQLGRAGRSVAESGRELAPQDTREQVRAIIAALPASHRPWRMGWRTTVMTLGAVVVAAMGYIGLTSSHQPEVIDAVVADYRAPSHVGVVVEANLPTRLGDLRYLTSYATTVENMDVVAHAYEDSAGHEVVVYQAEATFPVADGAEHSSNGRTWRAATDGVVLFCADRPIPSLVVGDDEREVALAAEELGLR